MADLKDMSDAEYMALHEKAYDDDKLQSDFILRHGSDFYEWLMVDRGVHHDEAPDYEFDYIEVHHDKFLAFANAHYNKKAG